VKKGKEKKFPAPRGPLKNPFCGAVPIPKAVAHTSKIPLGKGDLGLGTPEVGLPGRGPACSGPLSKGLGETAPQHTCAPGAAVWRGAAPGQPARVRLAALFACFLPGRQSVRSQLHWPACKHPAGAAGPQPEARQNPEARDCFPVSSGRRRLGRPQCSATGAEPATAPPPPSTAEAREPSRRPLALLFGKGMAWKGGDWSEAEAGSRLRHGRQQGGKRGFQKGQGSRGELAERRFQRRTLLFVVGRKRCRNSRNPQSLRQGAFKGSAVTGNSCAAALSQSAA